MKAVILVGGDTSSGGFPPNSKPKCLYHVGGETLLGRIVRCLKEEGVEDIRAVVGYRREDIQKYSDENNLNLELVDVPWRTDAMESLRIALSGIDDDVLIMYGDILLRRDVVRGFLDNIAPLAWIATPKPYCDYINEIQDGHNQICVCKIGKEMFHILDNMEDLWQRFIKRNPRYAKKGPESAFIFDGVLAEALYANPPLGLVLVDFVGDVDRYVQMDEAPWLLKLKFCVRQFLKEFRDGVLSWV